VGVGRPGDLLVVCDRQIIPRFTKDRTSQRRGVIYSPLSTVAADFSVTQVVDGRKAFTARFPAASFP
jgi:hypothetical protein